MFNGEQTTTLAKRSSVKVMHPSICIFTRGF
ncbi:hypothetical protein FOQG_14541 [Fusarium oxysporum f. sp. raphani 54005]|uniref:Uncharacterized protein n=4 Tax=Fusarium oxysporum TaxID=5507 RepID=X0BGR8_FUSOX|nr:hypothetical protein FOVG_12327 [Fusarium oxysporum f. sp. pisi HDV247]EXK81016.1 hypothetical protein FOQG_14541 [Fusarium oxysporum f. sp. raphani 54005]EXL70854.1 hypothetical protein FOPG_13341 [Fusarium oxysporum f. sp. conglutinans race 2 54008]EXM18342.1 hypothetical protein FOTG_13617 [Fusarium oxysporum f. sp. vasinfectum 25433]